MSDESARHEQEDARDASGPEPGKGQESKADDRRESGGRERRESDREDRRDAGAEGRPVESVQLPGASSAFMIMVLHLFTFLCCANWIFGPMGIVFAVRASMSRDRGQYRQADTLVRYSWMCLGAGLVMLIVTVLLTVLLFALGVPLLRDISGYQPY